MGRCGFSTALLSSSGTVGLKTLVSCNCPGCRICLNCADKYYCRIKNVDRTNKGEACTRKPMPLKFKLQVKLKKEF